MNEYRILHDWNYVRRLVRTRDQGVCAICDTDTLWLQNVIKQVRSEFTVEEQHRLLAACGQTTMPRYGQPYEVDHIKPRADGGDNQLSNLRTLCFPCHKRVTAAFAKVRAERKRAAKATLFTKGSAA